MEATNPNTGKIAVFFQKALTKARNILHDPEKLQKLLDTGRQKVLELRQENKKIDEVMHQFTTALRLIKAFKNKEYTQIPWKSILTLTAGIVYFVMPLDLIPDFIPVMGLLDDASVMVWIFSALKKDIEDFEAWEQSVASNG